MSHDRPKPYSLYNWMDSIARDEAYHYCERMRDECELTGEDIYVMQGYMYHLHTPTPSNLEHFRRLLLVGVLHGVVPQEVAKRLSSRAARYLVEHQRKRLAAVMRRDAMKRERNINPWQDRRPQ